MAEGVVVHATMLLLDSFTVANAPSAANYLPGTVIYVSNGAGGTPILAFSDGTNWKRVDTGATIS